MTKIKRKQYEGELRTLQAELVALQEWVKASGAHPRAVFRGRRHRRQGRDDQAITDRVSRGVRVVALSSPTEREKSQMYVQRYIPHLPAAGEVVIFDRSWYNRAGVERVMGFSHRRAGQAVPADGARRGAGDGRLRDLAAQVLARSGRGRADPGRAGRPPGHHPQHRKLSDTPPTWTAGGTLNMPRPRRPRGAPTLGAGHVARRTHRRQAARAAEPMTHFLSEVRHEERRHAQPARYVEDEVPGDNHAQNGFNDLIHAIRTVRLGGLPTLDGASRQEHAACLLRRRAVVAVERSG